MKDYSKITITITLVEKTVLTLKILYTPSFSLFILKSLGDQLIHGPLFIVIGGPIPYSIHIKRD